MKSKQKQDTGRTLDPIGIHLYDFIHQLYRMATLALRLPDLLRIPAFRVDKAQNVQCHCGYLIQLSCKVPGCWLINLLSLLITGFFRKSLVVCGYLHGVGDKNENNQQRKDKECWQMVVGWTFY